MSWLCFMKSFAAGTLLSESTKRRLLGWKETKKKRIISTCLYIFETFPLFNRFSFYVRVYISFLLWGEALTYIIITDIRGASLASLLPVSAEFLMCLAKCRIRLNHFRIGLIFLFELLHNDLNFSCLLLDSIPTTLLLAVSVLESSVF